MKCISRVGAFAGLDRYVFNEGPNDVVRLTRCGIYCNIDFLMNEALTLPGGTNPNECEMNRVENQLDKVQIQVALESSAIGFLCHFN